MEELFYDVAIVGAGAAGLAAGGIAAAVGRRTVVIDREELPGGILRQCIHNGFGLRYFKEELTGPEYAEKIAEKAIAAGAELALNTTVLELSGSFGEGFRITALSVRRGMCLIHAKAIILAMGCRERNRGNIAIPGCRPASIFTAGAAQRLLNLEGLLPGKSAVIVGSGDIGLIMARRLMWAGIQVKAVVEIMPYAAGLTRNVVQCLEDFGIPLLLSHSVVNIHGRQRVEGVDLAPLVNGHPQMESAFRVDCDTLLFSVGLVPENELATSIGVQLNPATGGAVTDSNYETTVPGIFAGGNVLHVHDLVDFVSEEAENAARAVLRRLDGEIFGERSPAEVQNNLKYVVPNFYYPEHPARFAFRPLIVANDVTLEAERNGNVFWRKHFAAVRPAEMLIIDLNARELSAPGKISFRLIPASDAK